MPGRRGESGYLGYGGAKDLGSQGLGGKEKIFLGFGLAKCLGVGTGLVTNFCNLGTWKSGKNFGLGLGVGWENEGGRVTVQVGRKKIFGLGSAGSEIFRGFWWG